LFWQKDQNHQRRQLLNKRKKKEGLYVLLFWQKDQNHLRRQMPPALEKYRKSRQSSASSCLLGKHTALLRRADAFAGFAGVFQFTAPPPACLRGPTRQLKDDFFSGTTFYSKCLKTSRKTIRSIGWRKLLQDSKFY
jgi:hypothetical protein